MKTRIFILFLSTLFIILSCKKNDDKYNTPAPQKELPTVETIETTGILYTWATIGGKIISQGKDSITEQGICFSEDQDPSISDFVVFDSILSNEFLFKIEHLKVNTTYYIRAFATNSFGTSYSEESQFSTMNVPSEIYSEGNTYKIVKIGNQYWFANNLADSHYKNGDPIPQVTDSSEWSNLETGAFCYYNNNINNNPVYGKLYNFYAISDERNICPEGFKIPTIDDFDTLKKYINNNLQGTYAGGTLKEIGIEHWREPNVYATDEFGFKALPSGIRSEFSEFINLYEVFSMWIYWNNTTSNSMQIALFYDYGAIEEFIMNKKSGLAVRCILIQ